MLPLTCVYICSWFLRLLPMWWADGIPIPWNSPRLFCTVCANVQLQFWCLPSFPDHGMAAAAQAQVYTRSYCILTRFTWLCPLQLCMKLLDLQRSWNCSREMMGPVYWEAHCFLHLWSRQQYESCKYTGFRSWAMCVPDQNWRCGLDAVGNSLLLLALIEPETESDPSCYLSW